MTRLPGSGDGARLLVSDARPSCLVRRRLAPLARRCRGGGAGVWALIPGGSKGTNNLRVLTIAFSPDGRTLATSGADGSIYLWDVATGHLVATHTDPGPEESIRWRSARTAAYWRPLVLMAASTCGMWGGPRSQTPDLAHR